MYMNEAVPSVLFDKPLPGSPAAAAQWFVLGTGALIYDLYPGPVTADGERASERAYPCGPVFMCDSTHCICTAVCLTGRGACVYSRPTSISPCKMHLTRQA